MFLWLHAMQLDSIRVSAAETSALPKYVQYGWLSALLHV